MAHVSNLQASSGARSSRDGAHGLWLGWHKANGKPPFCVSPNSSYIFVGFKGPKGPFFIAPGPNVIIVPDMHTDELIFDFPNSLVATERKPNSRAMWVDEKGPVEVSPAYVLTQIQPNDLLVINDTKVIKARIHSDEGMEILFIKEFESNVWQVLCPARRWPKGASLKLPNDVLLELVEGGLPQKVRANKKLEPSFFLKFGEMPLPPYIQEARGERHARAHDDLDYQTAWANQLGSLASPTASLHFSQEDLEKVKKRGADVKAICLHVGLGTFLPVHAESLEDHQMHSEFVSIPKDTWQAVLQCCERGGRVWALGSTVTRALESQALKMLNKENEEYVGETDLFIRPGFEFQVVDVLMTNFHQPQTTLLAMVMAFAGQRKVLQCYQWAIEKRFRLFSYGDLSVWVR